MAVAADLVVYICSPKLLHQERHLRKQLQLPHHPEQLHHRPPQLKLQVAPRPLQQRLLLHRLPPPQLPLQQHSLLLLNRLPLFTIRQLC